MRSALSFTLRTFLLFAIAAGAWAAAPGQRDAAFARVPFDAWLNGAKQSHINWSVEIPPPELSAHQRMLVRISLTLDGRELEKRRGPGDFIAFLQLQDAAGNVWQNHTAFDLEALQPEMRSRNIVISHYAFVLPGDYAVALALWHSETGEHAMIRRHVHVNAVPNDPLPGSWARLPAVEFIGANDTPDVWFLPDVANTLYLPVRTRRPVHVEILLNTGSSERNAGSLSALRRNMSLLVPALKALGAMRLSEGSVDVELLDLTHRKVPFTQRDVRALDWDGMRGFFLDTNPGVVDVHTLANEWRMRGYFFDELSRRLTAKEEDPHVVIVLSGPAFLGDQAAVEVTPDPPDPNTRLFYVRYRPDPLRYFAERRFRPGARPMPRPVVRPMPADDLEKTAAPLHPRVFDAISAEQFRRIVAAIAGEISQL